jgi:hypothetical protein
VAGAQVEFTATSANGGYQVSAINEVQSKQNNAANAASAKAAAELGHPPEPVVAKQINTVNVLRPAVKEMFRVNRLDPEKLNEDRVEVEALFLVKAESSTVETIPAVYRTAGDRRELVKPEKKIVYPIPAVYETRKYHLIMDGEPAKTLRGFAAKKADVEISGVQTPQGFRMSAVNEAGLTTNRTNAEDGF